MKRFVLLIVLTTGCQRAVQNPVVVQSTAAATTSDTRQSLSLEVGEGPKDFPGVHNLVRVSEKLISGGSPEGAEGFRTLRDLGVKTVITVDGARPEVDEARKFGLRYVHLPIGYDSVPRDQALRLARAVRDLPGKVYLHCHHGKHRSPAAAVAVQRCLDGECTADKALAVLKQAGTGLNYTGLYAAPNQFEAIRPEELDKVPADFPEIAPTGMFVQMMVEVDVRWDHLKLVRAAGWKSPPKHPDLDPAHEALLLREAYRECVRAPEAEKQPAEMKVWMADAEQGAGVLETVLRKGKAGGMVDAVSAEAAFQRAAGDCKKCHAKYRDVPRK